MRVEMLSNASSTDSLRSPEEADTKRWEAERIAVLVRSTILARSRTSGEVIGFSEIQTKLT
jgi:hypothetical protein